MAVSKADIHSEIEQLAGLHEATEADNERLRRELEDSDAENAELRAHLDAQEQRLTQLEELSVRLTESSDSAQSGDGDEQLARLERELQRREEIIEVLQETLRTHEALREDADGHNSAPPDKASDAASAADTDEQLSRLERELERREEVIEVLQEALRTHEALLEEAHAQDDDIADGDSAAFRRRLATARHQIRALTNDLRVRSDVIDALESDAVALQITEARLEESASHNHFLRNELGLALNEIARLRKREKDSGQAPATAPAERASDVAALLMKLEESEARNRSLDATVTALERLLSADDVVLSEDVVLSGDENQTRAAGGGRR